jgi:uncharacterized protein DUF2460
MMASFPKLKTGAVAQYPVSKGLRFQNQIVRFLDGTDQRYRDSGEVLHEWNIRLSELDEAEMTAVEQFFVDNQGRFGSFEFTDPWDSQLYPNCSIASDVLGLIAVAETRGTASIKIVENRS